MSLVRAIPSIERLRQRPRSQALEARYGPALVVDALREEAETLRGELLAAANAGPAGASTADRDIVAELEHRIEARLAARVESRLRPVINATGVIVHTNLGRAPLAETAIARVADVARGYAALEYDLGHGRRGARDVHADGLLRQLTGAEAAVVVNNNAAATMLVLAALAVGREAVISRGELVEIGGGFRVPDILVQSGVILREVGTTNRTRVADYGAAIGERTAIVLRVHPSNFRVEGFTERPALADLVGLAHAMHVPVVEDLGSGFIAGSWPASSSPQALAGEPSVEASIAAGVDVVCFSGDKLLGGPQAGIIVGRTEPLQRIRRHPLMRALRVDKMTYAALEATLVEHVTGRAPITVPVLRMTLATRDELAARVTALQARIRGSGALRCEQVPGFSTIGGGSVPQSALPTMLLALVHATLDAARLDARLRALATPVIARILDDRVVLDLRTVLPEQDETLAGLLATV